MAKLMNDEQRLATLEAYNPQEHLMPVGKNRDGSQVLYYPAAWRLYELRLRHPHFTLEAEIFHMDEHGNVIVKAIGYDGLDYASSNLKGTAMKQGKIAELDKVETKAMSRVARNIGIGTEYALEFDADETDVGHKDTSSNHTNNAAQAASRTAQPQQAVPTSLQVAQAVKDKLKATATKAVSLGKATDYKSFYVWASDELAIVASAANLSMDNLVDLDARLDRLAQQSERQAS